ncbi:hypothetical protein C1646_758702 [Rhizophagus diaphanus]|nr:hypothetical protein C1646_758702 [Rhizophagus diaphanus] [Rhizophagus sp. MUCL 43196]
MSTGLQRTTIKILLISCKRISFDIYIDEIARLSSARKAREEIKGSKINKESVLEDMERIICKNYGVIDGLRKEIFMEKEGSKIDRTVGRTINRTEEVGFKEIYRAEKREKKRDVVKVDNKKIEERRNDRVTEPLLDTPPQKVFSELVVDVIKKYREGVEEDVERDIITSKKLQKDNVTTEEEKHHQKVEELKNIFKECGEEMEWEAIEKKANEGFKMERYSLPRAEESLIITWSDTKIYDIK